MWLISTVRCVAIEHCAHLELPLIHRLTHRGWLKHSREGGQLDMDKLGDQRDHPVYICQAWKEEREEEHLSVRQRGGEEEGATRPTRDLDEKKRPDAGEI